MRSTMALNTRSMISQEQKLNMTSNNIANVNTTGYKKVTGSFEEAMAHDYNRVGVPNSTQLGLEGIGTGTKMSTPVRDNTQGVLMKTSSPTHLALDGQGYFRVTLSDGSEAFTRDGAFMIDSAGNIVDSSGNRLDVLDMNGNTLNLFDIDQDFRLDQLMIAEDGLVYMRDGDDTTQIGRIPIYNVIGDEGLVAAGNNNYVLADGITAYETNNVSIYQGYLERANVEMVDEFADLMFSQRIYSMSTKCMSTADQMWSMINNMR